MTNREEQIAELKRKHADDYNWNASELQVALHALKMNIVFDSRDWGADRRDARTFAIIVGWDDEGYEEFVRRGVFTTEAVEVLKRRHAAVKEAMGKFPAELVQW